VTKKVKQLSDLTPDSRNANRGTQRGRVLLEKSLRRYGAGRSILADKHGAVIAGNKTLEVAADIGLPVRVIETDGTELVVVQRTDLDLGTDKAAVELGIADNRVGQVSLEWDGDVLAQRAAEGLDLGQWWNKDELAEIVKNIGEPAADPGADVDRAAELQAKWGTATGQLWEIGAHRLLCGDSTKAEDVARVMGGEKASLVMTSPPYWVGKKYEQEKTWSDVQAFISRLCAVLTEFTTHRIVINTGAPPAAHLTGKRAHVRLLLDDYQRELETHGWLMRYVRIWAKRGGLAHTAPQSDCIDQHWEFIGVFYDPKNYEGQRRCGEKWATDGIWDDVTGTMSANDHVAAFPVDIPERNITRYTDPGAIVLEPFCGSGTTLVVCEQLGRKGRGIELDPAYVAVTLERLSGLGLTPKLMEG
jgi:hypothetical protein